MKGKTREEQLELIESLETQVREGHSLIAYKKLRSLNPSEFDPTQVALLANLCRRLGHGHTSFRWLKPLVWQQIELGVNPEPKVLLEFVYHLATYGSLDEAHELLDWIDFDQYPQAHLATISILFKQWRYQDSIPHLKQYIKKMKNAPYQVAIGTINLAACYVFLKQDMAEETVRNLIEICQANSYTVLLGNAYELLSQVFIDHGEYAQALELLSRAEKILQENQGSSLLFVEKWQSIVGLLKNPTSQQTKQRFFEFKQKAALRKNWETVRSCDFYFSLATRDRETSQRVYFGTPFAPYRQMLEQQLSKDLFADANYLWTPQGDLDHKTEKSRVLSVSNLTFDGRPVPIKQGQLLHNFLKGICTDFYKPASIGFFHRTLYSGEHFDVKSSTEKIVRLKKRLNKVFKQADIPLLLRSSDNQFVLESTAPLVIKVPKEYSFKDRQSELAGQVISLFPNKDFTTSDIQGQFHVSERTAQRLIQYGIEKGYFEQRGGGKKTHYLIKKAS